MRSWIRHVRIGDLLPWSKARRGGAVTSLADIVRWRRQQRLENEPLVRIDTSARSLKLWPRREFQDQAMLHAIESVFGQFGFAVQRHFRPVTARQTRRLRRNWSDKHLQQAFPNGVTPYLKVPLEVRLDLDAACNTDLIDSLSLGSEWKSLKEVRDIVAGVRMRHLPPNSSGYEFFM